LLLLGLLLLPGSVCPWRETHTAASNVALGLSDLVLTTSPLLIVLLRRAVVHFSSLIVHIVCHGDLHLLLLRHEIGLRLHRGVMI